MPISARYKEYNRCFIILKNNVTACYIIIFIFVIFFIKLI